jgi:hypothetical protein
VRGHAAAPDQLTKSVVQPGREVLDPQQMQPRRRQLNGQRDPVRMAAHLGDDAGGLVCQCEVWRGGLCS